MNVFWSNAVNTYKSYANAINQLMMQVVNKSHWVLITFALLLFAKYTKES